MVTSQTQIMKRLVRELAELEFAPPVAAVYNPLVYARAAHDQYLKRFGSGKKEIVLLGMNPGPWGMAQTGVPFGEIEAVRDWMGIEAKIGKPDPEHPKRPIEGFACTRSEVSGRRLWSFFQSRYPRAEDFFARFFVLNFCPLVFMEESGRNRTPDKLPAAEREALFAACDRALLDSVKLLAPDRVIGIGGFAQKRAREVLGHLDLRIDTLLHPSPASPAANRGWAEAASSQLADLGIRLP